MTAQNFDGPISSETPMITSAASSVVCDGLVHGLGPEAFTVKFTMWSPLTSVQPSDVSVMFLQPFRITETLVEIPSYCLSIDLPPKVLADGASSA